MFLTQELEHLSYVRVSSNKGLKEKLGNDAARGFCQLHFQSSVFVTPNSGAWGFIERIKCNAPTNVCWGMRHAIGCCCMVQVKEGF